MRVNVYAEEIEKRVEIVEARADDTGRIFYGIRFYLDSPGSLHQTPEDDDSSAVTFWIPWTEAGGHDVSNVLWIFRLALDKVSNIAEMVRHGSS